MNEPSTVRETEAWAYPASAETSTAKLSRRAIAAFVLGIVGMVMGCVGIGIVISIAGVVLGIVAIRAIGQPGQPYEGKSFAIAGVITGGVGILVGVLFWVILISAFGAARVTSQQIASYEQAQVIHRAIVDHDQSNFIYRFHSNDIGVLIAAGYFPIELTQSPMDYKGSRVPQNFGSLSIEEQANWAREHSDYVIVPGVSPKSEQDSIMVFGKLGRFDNGVPVVFADGVSQWVFSDEVTDLDLMLQHQTSRSISRLTQEAELMAAEPLPLFKVSTAALAHSSATRNLNEDQKQSLDRALEIRQVMFDYAQATQIPEDVELFPGDEDEKLFLPKSISDVLAQGYIALGELQSPSHPQGATYPEDFQRMTERSQEEWLRLHSDYMIFGGLIHREYPKNRPIVIGRPDRFNNGVPVAFSNGRVEWYYDDEMRLLDNLMDRLGTSIYRYPHSLQELINYDYYDGASW